MRTERPWTRPPFAYRVALLQAATVTSVTLIVQLLLTAVSLGPAIGVSLVTGAITGLVALWLARGRQRRIERLTMVSEAWLRGNLALKATDSGHDELAMLARKLNVLVEHLEEDEQDLDRLGESNTRLTDQVRALAVVEERNRLARELHDTVKQHLFSLAMTASAVRTLIQLQSDKGGTMSPEFLEMVREIEASAQIAQQETTRLIEDLRPAPLQERGLAAALNDYTLIFGARQHLLVYLDVQCNDQWLPAVVTETLYRVAQEALHNVARHARATRVDIRLHCAAQRVILSIEDNGIGFNTRRTRKGLGISSMQERLIAVGGRLTVTSQPGTGTTIQAEVEITPRPASRALSDTSAATEEPTPPEGSRLPDLLPEGDRVESVGAGSAASPVVRPEAWAWLGERLVIPVGQVWPWLPVEQERYLRHPTASPGRLELKWERRLLGLRQTHVLQSKDKGTSTLVRLVEERAGYHWDMGGAEWTLRRVRGLRGRALLECKGQVLAAMHYRGRQMDTWTEIIYDDRIYRLTYGERAAGDFVLLDDQGAPVLSTQPNGREAVTPRGQVADVTLHTHLPLPLVAIVIARIVDEAAVRQATEGV